MALDTPELPDPTPTFPFYHEFVSGLRDAGAKVVVEDVEPLETVNRYTTPYALVTVEGRILHCHFHSWYSNKGEYPLYNVRVGGIGGVAKSVSYSIHAKNVEQQAVKVLKRVRLVKERFSTTKGVKQLTKKCIQKIESRTGLSVKGLRLSESGKVQRVTFGPDILERLGVDLDTSKPVRNPPSIWEHLDAE